jgi:hypothetical protein
MTTYVISSGDTGGGATLSDGDVLEVLQGGLTLGNSIGSGATELIDAGGADIAMPPLYVTTVFGGGLEDVFGVANNGAVLAACRTWRIIWRTGYDGAIDSPAGWA